jgi:hypothetical protein
MLSSSDWMFLTFFFIKNVLKFLIENCLKNGAKKQEKQNKCR